MWKPNRLSHLIGTLVGRGAGATTPGGRDSRPNSWSPHRFRSRSDSCSRLPSLRRFVGSTSVVLKPSLPQDAGECLGMQFVSWLSGHRDYAWLRRMSVLSMRSSGAGVNPAVTLNELQDCWEISSAQDANARWSFDQDVSKDRAVVAASAGSARTVARVGSSVILSGPMPAGEAVNCVAVGEDPPTTPDLPVRAWQPV